VQLVSFGKGLLGPRCTCTVSLARWLTRTACLTMQLTKAPCRPSTGTSSRSPGSLVSQPRVIRLRPRFSPRAGAWEPLPPVERAVSRLKLFCKQFTHASS
jgi:hypothetical protein